MWESKIVWRPLLLQRQYFHHLDGNWAAGKNWLCDPQRSREVCDPRPWKTFSWPNAIEIQCVLYSSVWTPPCFRRAVKWSDTWGGYLEVYQEIYQKVKDGSCFGQEPSKTAWTGESGQRKLKQGKGRSSWELMGMYVLFVHVQTTKFELCLYSVWRESSTLMSLNRLLEQVRQISPHQLWEI